MNEAERDSDQSDEHECDENFCGALEALIIAIERKKECGKSVNHSPERNRYDGPKGMGGHSAGRHQSCPNDESPNHKVSEKVILNPFPETFCPTFEQG